jgi:prolyl 4-hydroxylase
MFFHLVLTHSNHWDSPTDILNVEDPNLKGGGYVLKQHVWNAARDTIQEWTGQSLAECSLYGIRVYRDNAILATHVDRLPLVASAIINVDQDVDEPWPLEVIGHDGIARNITMVPGDLVLYESHSVLHGRPFPMKGRFMANGTLLSMFPWMGWPVTHKMASLTFSCFIYILIQSVYSFRTDWAN